MSKRKSLIRFVPGFGFVAVFTELLEAGRARAFVLAIPTVPQAAPGMNAPGSGIDAGPVAMGFAEFAQGREPRITIVKPNLPASFFLEALKRARPGGTTC